MNDEHYEWRYLPNGNVAHAISAPLAKVSLCGVGPAWWDDWRGTGVQSEYERLAMLPHCKRCVKVANAGG